MLTESELEAIEKRLGNFLTRGAEGTSLHGAKRDYRDFTDHAPTDIAALLADLKLYKKAVEEARTLMRNGDIDRYLKFCPALATILKGVKG